MITGITVGGARRNMSAVPVSPVQPAPVRNGRRTSSVGRRVRTSYDGGMLVSAGMDKQGEGEFIYGREGDGMQLRVGL